MKHILDEQIIAIAPYMFIIHRFECGDGWFGLLKKLTEDLAKLDIARELRVTQVKEKFGSLRWYLGYSVTPRLTGAEKNISDLITQAEKKSEKICGLCGKKGKIRSHGGWLMCRCDDCAGDR